MYCIGFILFNNQYRTLSCITIIYPQTQKHFSFPNERMRNSDAQIPAIIEKPDLKPIRSLYNFVLH